MGVLEGSPGGTRAVRGRTGREEISVTCDMGKEESLFKYTDAWKEGNRGIFW